jgi:hypothetical protein
LAYAKQNQISTALLQNASGQYVAPSDEAATATADAAVAALPANTDYRISIVNAKGATAYPIASFTWLLVYKQQTDPVKAKKLADFIRWALTDGKKDQRGSTTHRSACHRQLTARVDSVAPEPRGRRGDGGVRRAKQTIQRRRRRTRRPPRGGAARALATALSVDHDRDGVGHPISLVCHCVEVLRRMARLERSALAFTSSRWDAVVNDQFGAAGAGDLSTLVLGRRSAMIIAVPLPVSVALFLSGVQRRCGFGNRSRFWSIPAPRSHSEASSF